MYTGGSLGAVASGRGSVGEINNLEKSLANPQIVDRDMVLPLVNEDSDVIRVAGNRSRCRGQRRRATNTRRN